jgi:hypothetical protein
MQLSAEPIDLLEAHNQWRPLIRIDPIGVTLHEQIGMDANALDPHFDQTEEAARFFTVFANVRGDFNGRSGSKAPGRGISGVGQEQTIAASGRLAETRHSRLDLANAA